MTQKYPNNLNRAIERSGMTIAEISEETRIGERTLYTYRAGEVPVPKDRRDALAECLGYSAEYLFPPLANLRADYALYSGSEEAKDLEVLFVLRKHCEAHPTDENTLQQLMELLGKIGRYREAEQRYERFVQALAQDVIGQEPDPDTLKLLAQLRVQEAHACSSERQAQLAQARRHDALPNVPLASDTSLSPRSDQQDAHASPAEPTPSPNPQTSSDQATVIQTSRVQIVVQPFPDETPSGRTIPSVLITSPSFLDPAAQSGRPPSPISDSIASSSSPSVSPQPIILVRGINAEKLDVDVSLVTPQENNDMDANKRNSIQKIGTALGSSILLNSALGLQPLSLAQRGIKLHDEELLDICKTEISIWWRLYLEGHHAEIRNILSGCLFRLSTLAEHPSRYQQLAGNLASQAHQLAWLLAIQQQDFSTALMHTKQAFQYGVIAKDFNLQASAITREGYVYDLVNDPESMLYVYQKAFEHCEKMPPLIQGRMYAGLAKTHGFLKQEQEADHFLGLTRDTFPEHPEKEPTYSYTLWGRFTILNDEVITWLQLNKPNNAWQACEKIARTATLSATRRVELLIRQAETSLALGKMDQCCSYIEQAVVAAWELDSDLRYNQAYNVYQLLLDKWPREKEVRDLAVLFQRK